MEAVSVESPLSYNNSVLRYCSTLGDYRALANGVVILEYCHTLPQ